MTQNFSNLLRTVALNFWTQILKPLTVAAVIMCPLRSAVADWNWVPSGSMKPTILVGDLVFVNKLAYDLKVPFTVKHLAQWSNPQHEDIVVFFSPEDQIRLVKRVIGCPGDSIAMRQGELYRNGTKIAVEPSDTQKFQHETTEDSTSLLFKEHGDTVTHWTMTLPHRWAPRTLKPFVVPEGQYFMMGDSRDNSHDSRFFGFVDRNLIVGKAERVLVSLDKNHGFVPRLTRFLSTLYPGV